MGDFRIEFRVDAAAAGVRAPKGATANGRKIGGQFLKGGAQGQLLAINRQIASELQAEIVANIQSRIKRPAASTNRLVTVTADQRNAVATFDSVHVGNVDFLNSSVAKYWRTIEEGSAEVWYRPFVGTQLYPKGKPTFPVPHGATPGLRTYNLDGEGLPWMDGRRYVVKREIAPMHAYRDAWTSFRPGQRAFAAVNDYLRTIRGLPYD